MPINNAMNRKQYLKALKKAEREKWERVFAFQLKAEGFYLGEDPENLLSREYAREYEFHPVRDWRFDFLIADPDGSITKYDPELILVDIQGGIWSKGAHVRGGGYQNDVDKMNAATALGWRVLWFTSEMVEDGSAIQFLKDQVWQ